MRPLFCLTPSRLRFSDANRRSRRSSSASIKCSIKLLKPRPILEQAVQYSTVDRHGSCLHVTSLMYFQAWTILMDLIVQGCCPISAQELPAGHWQFEGHEGHYPKCGAKNLSNTCTTFALPLQFLCRLSGASLTMSQHQFLCVSNVFSCSSMQK